MMKRGQLQLPTAPLTTLSKAGAAAIAFDGADLQLSVNGGAYLPIQTGAAAAAAPNQAVQFNSAGAFDGDASFVFDSFSGILSVGGISTNLVESQGINNLLLNTVSGNRVAVGGELAVVGTVTTNTLDASVPGALGIGQNSATSINIGSGAGSTNALQLFADVIRVGLLAGQEINIADHASALLSFWGAAGVAKPAVAGSAGANAALASLLTALDTMGLITDNST
jgi:hypothetical protein